MKNSSHNSLNNYTSINYFLSTKYMMLTIYLPKVMMEKSLDRKCMQILKKVSLVDIGPKGSLQKIRENSFPKLYFFTFKSINTLSVFFRSIEMIYK
ncbi:hypothetical protein BpHYR1_027805 [Brachionus plicatilis]|uniref:Uncharacterized protein n=1 Tax=Brachionus plicatilis TaxID=10195 RepID=A0A3M7P242_BRAPC|nr:hypothetical protein BpHYR1_027805 [Brachionus plicatilis]